MVFTQRVHKRTELTVGMKVLVEVQDNYRPTAPKVGIISDFNLRFIYVRVGDSVNLAKFNRNGVESGVNERYARWLIEYDEKYLEERIEDQLIFDTRRSTKNVLMNIDHKNVNTLNLVQLAAVSRQAQALIDQIKAFEEENKRGG